MNEEEKKQFKETINECTQNFLMLKMIESQVESPDLKELSFFRQTVELDDGGIYLLSFQHVKGPKIQLKKDQNEDSNG